MNALQIEIYIRAVGSLVESTSAFRKEIRKHGANRINVGYVRKSPGYEITETHQRFLKGTIMKVKNSR
ncbi:hypothetical protein BD770DRAFT_376331 [Pilaira anomala]|nr:hypothetical protein BD770DRAFT_376331 [Pilaira anomala]